MKVTTLKGYLGEINLTLKDFSFIVDCSVGYLSQVCSGRLTPSFQMAKRIEEATGGVVLMEYVKRKKTRRKKNQTQNDQPS